MIIKYPVSNPIISQPFGFDNTNNPDRSTFYTLFNNKHPGVDFPVSENTEVYASFEGIVVRKEFHKGMGKVLGIRNGNIVALYAHLNEFKVNLGDIVRQRTLIGLSGDTGDACLSPHLHFELRDIAKPSLKEMVFEPEFDEEVSQYISTFKYVVNNKNTQKTLKDLSKLYFGSENVWELLKKANKYNFDGDHFLPTGLELTIPNY